MQLPGSAQRDLDAQTPKRAAATVDVQAATEKASDNSPIPPKDGADDENVALEQQGMPPDPASSTTRVES